MEEEPTGGAGEEVGFKERWQTLQMKDTSTSCSWNRTTSKMENLEESMQRGESEHKRQFGVTTF